MREQRSVELAMVMVRFISAAMASPLYMACVHSDRQMGTRTVVMLQDGYRPLHVSRRCSVHVLCSPFDLNVMCPIVFDLTELAPSFEVIEQWDRASADYL